LLRAAVGNSPASTCLNYSITPPPRPDWRSPKSDWPANRVRPVPILPGRVHGAEVMLNLEDHWVLEGIPEHDTVAIYREFVSVLRDAYARSPISSQTTATSHPPAFESIEFTSPHHRDELPFSANPAILFKVHRMSIRTFHCASIPFRAVPGRRLLFERGPSSVSCVGGLDSCRLECKLDRKAAFEL
jgi:hypothetical protein